MNHQGNSRERYRREQELVRPGFMATAPDIDACDCDSGDDMGACAAPGHIGVGRA